MWLLTTLSIKLTVRSRLIVKFGGSQKLHVDFWYVEACIPNHSVIQESAVINCLFSIQLSIRTLPKPLRPLQLFFVLFRHKIYEASQTGKTSCPKIQILRTEHWLGSWIWDGDCSPRGRWVILHSQIFFVLTLAKTAALLCGSPSC